MINCLITNPVIDVTYELDRLVGGATHVQADSGIEAAGKAINVAKAVRALGHEATVVGLMPEQSAPQFEHALRERGIPAHFFRVRGCVRINATVLERENGQTTHISGKGPEIGDFDAAGFVSFVERLAREGGTWALCGSLPQGCDRHLYESMIGMLHEHGARSLLDSGGEPLKFGVRAKPAMIKPNHAELEEFFGEKIRGVHHIVLMGKRFLDRGIEYIFVSLGADGIIAIHSSDCLLCSAPPVQALDTVGCGDALVAGLLAGMERKYSLSEVCRLGVACGVSNALHRGAGNIDANEAMRIMEDVKVCAV